MKTISIRVGKEISEGMKRVMENMHYHSKSAFIRDAIRHRMKESKLDRERDLLWHKLLSNRHVEKGKIPKVKVWF